MCFATWCHRLIVVTELEAFLAMSTTVVQLLRKGHDDPVEVMADQLTASAIGNLFAVGGHILVLIIFFYYPSTQIFTLPPEVRDGGITLVVEEAAHSVQQPLAISAM